MHSTATNSTDREKALDTDRFSGFAGKALFVAAGLIVLSAGLVWAAREAGDRFVAGGYTDQTHEIEVVIANDVLRIPANMFRFADQRKNGERPRLDLAFHWPSMSGYRQSLQHAFNAEPGRAAIVYLAIAPRRMRRDMSGRIEPIYANYFSGTPESSIGNLVKMRLERGEVYRNEYLAVERNSPYPFAARCTERTDEIDAPFCLRDIHMGRNLSVSFRFPASMLGEWRPLEAAIRDLMKRLLQ